MNKADLARSVADKTGLSQSAASDALDAVLESIEKELAGGGEVAVRGGEVGGRVLLPGVHAGIRAGNGLPAIFQCVWGAARPDVTICGGDSAVDREKIEKDIESQKEKKKNYLEKTESSFPL